MSLVVHQIALEAIATLRPLLPRIQRHDRNLATQLKDAASSAALNIGEAEYSDPGTRRARFHTAAGSANETRSALAVAIAWGYVTRDEATVALELFDRVVAMLWRLLHGRR
jgi:four helix bundle protein